MPKQIARDISQHMQGQRADHWPPQGAQAADDCAHQRFHRRVGTISNTRVNVLKHLDVKRARSAHKTARKNNRAEFDGKRVDTRRLGRVFVVAHCLQIGTKA